MGGLEICPDMMPQVKEIMNDEEGGEWQLFIKGIFCNFEEVSSLPILFRIQIL